MISSRLNLLQVEISDVSRSMQALRDEVEYRLEDVLDSVEKTMKHFSKELEKALDSFQLLKNEMEFAAGSKDQRSGDSMTIFSMKLESLRKEIGKIKL